MQGINSGYLMQSLFIPCIFFVFFSTRIYGKIEVLTDISTFCLFVFKMAKE